MKRILILAAISLLLCSTASALQDGSGKSTKKPEPKPQNASAPYATVAQPGFYITLYRCHACGLSRRQQDAMLSFRGRGFSAFYGNPEYDKAYNNIEFVEKIPGGYPNPVMVNLFVGPFQTEAAAQRVVSEIPSILRKQIAEDQVPERSAGLYDVRVVRVRSAKVTGSIPSLPSEDFVIQPGIGVGRVLIGSRRSDVQAVLGKPRGVGKDDDTWVSGTEFLTVYYRSGAVHAIKVGSPKFHTATGLTMASSGQIFLRAFPTSAKQCCVSTGCDGSEWTNWDAVTKGIALKRGGDSSLIVHRVNELFEDENAKCEPCGR